MIIDLSFFFEFFRFRYVLNRNSEYYFVYCFVRGGLFDVGSFFYLFVFLIVG